MAEDESYQAVGTCYKCNGAGYLYDWETAAPGKEPDKEQCDVCKGEGVVKQWSN